MRVYNIFEELLAFPSCCDLVWSSFLPILILSCWSSRLFLVCPSRLQSPVSSPSFFPFLVSFLPFSPLPPSEELSSSYPSSFLLSSLFLPCFLFFVGKHGVGSDQFCNSALCLFFYLFYSSIFLFSAFGPYPACQVPAILRLCSQAYKSFLLRHSPLFIVLRTSIVEVSPV